MGIITSKNSLNNITIQSRYWPLPWIRGPIREVFISRPIPQRSQPNIITECYNGIIENPLMAVMPCLFRKEQ